ncbi:Zinc finger protein 41 [Nymphon striatum]|nr:Zinc finger protein 41 [Nymphon striatum]
MRRHFKIHGNRTRHPCSYCEKTFARPDKVNQHIMKHHASKVPSKYQCSICGTPFMSEGSRSFCFAGTSGNWKSTCPKCLKTFSKRFSMLRHLKMHGDRSRNNCPFCYKSFAWHTDKMRHIKTNHSTECSAGYKCPICDTLFIYEAKLISKKSTCPTCLKIFTERSSMLRHFRIIHGDRVRHGCPHCEKSCSRPDDLSAHIKRFHSSKFSTKYKCPVCGVPGSKKSTCPKCLKKFSKRSSMLRHYRIHGDRVRHECPHCEKSFAWPDDLSAHLKKFHSSKFTTKYKCPVCGAPFMAERRYLYHLSQMHPNFM